VSDPINYYLSVDRKRLGPQMSALRASESRGAFY
jgi:hypothetical protein